MNPAASASASATATAAGSATADGSVVDAPPDGAVLDTPPGPGAAADAGVTPSRWRAAGMATLRWAAALAGALVIFGLFLFARGASPVDAYLAMLDSAFGDSRAIGDTLLRATPLLLAALAVAVPARAGMFNIGGEGQLVLGAVGAMAMSFALDGAIAGPPAFVLLALAGMVAGACWALIPAILKVVLRTNEAIVSLLLNYVAVIVLTWLVFEPWKDPKSTGQAYSKALPSDERLPILWANRVHVGIILAIVAAFVIWAAFRSTRWGFKLQVLGGNPEAARRAGLRVGALAVGAMAVGGALAGLGGMLEVSGVEGRLRPGIMVGFGYIGFLASWLAKHHPLKAIVSAFVLAAIAIGGNGLKIEAGVSGAAVNVLMALVLLAVLGFARPNTKATS
ncbi:MAG: ABC transporter permease [Acidimicrobiales bacterium]